MASISHFLLPQITCQFEQPVLICLLEQQNLLQSCFEMYFRLNATSICALTSPKTAKIRPGASLKSFRDG
jgi:hypothetical protein